MRKVLSLLLLLGLSLTALAQQTTRTQTSNGTVYTYTDYTCSTGRLTPGLLAPTALYHKLNYYTTGSPSSVGIRIDNTVDSGANWFVISSTEGSNTASMVSAYGAGNYVTPNVTTLSGGTSPCIFFTLTSFEFPPAGMQIVYSPSLLAISSSSVLSSASVLSSKIDMRGAKSVTFESSCDQTFNVGFEAFDESGGALYQDVVLFTGGIASNKAIVTINQGSAPTAVQNTGTTPTTNATAMTAGAGTPQLPMRTGKFFITNTSVSTASCTARAIEQF